MDYTAIYQRLIEKAKTRTIDGYKETHHIIPRCLGGTDDPSNLVDLTPEEHYLAHQLLVKIHFNNGKLLYAAVMMCSNRINNKLYGWLRRRLAEVQSEAMAGSGNTMFNKRWVANESETRLVEIHEANELMKHGKYIAGKIAIKAPCGCLVRKRCRIHDDKRKKTAEKKKREFVNHARSLFNEFLQSNVTSVTQFAKLKNTSQPALTKIWKKYVPEYLSSVEQGKSFKKHLTIK